VWIASARSSSFLETSQHQSCDLRSDHPLGVREACLLHTPGVLERWQNAMLVGVSPVSCLLITLSALFVASTLRIVLHEWASATLIFPSYYLAILIVSLFCGARWGILCTVLSLLVVNFVILPPAFAFSVPSREEVANSVYFASVALAIVWTAHVERSLLFRLQKKREVMGLLMRELRHRSKNHLTLVQAVIYLTLRGESGKADQIAQRIKSISQADDILTKSHDQTATLAELVLNALKLFEHAVRIEGPPVTVGPTIARVLALVLHELCTNATKYGGLSLEGGKVDVVWSIGERELKLDWTETGGPEPFPSSEGFGFTFMTTLLESAGGRIKTDFKQTGVSHSIHLTDWEA
jgi:two-component sensor histidine kinase